MTPKEKAEELVNKHLMILANVYDSLRTKNEMAKQCALICVDELINDRRNSYMDFKYKHWERVKQEINKK